MSLIALSLLEPALLKITGPTTHHVVDSLSEAQGVMFLCPSCFEKNRGPVGTHMILCWFAGRGVPDDEDPKPGRWSPSGTDLSDLTLVASILVPPDRSDDPKRCDGWHGYVEQGRVRTD